MRVIVKINVIKGKKFGAQRRSSECLQRKIYVTKSKKFSANEGPQNACKGQGCVRVIVKINVTKSN